jgi:hypothetical protein
VAALWVFCVMRFGLLALSAFSLISLAVNLPLADGSARRVIFVFERG